MMPHFLDLATPTAAGLRAILDEAHRRKAARAGWPRGRVDADAPLAGHVLAMIFEKPSTRTRFSFDMAIRQLGGTSIVATAVDMQLGRGETVEDTARVLGRMVDAVMIRSNSHATLETLADHAGIPVINALTDISHPCQVMADIMTFEERRGQKVEGSCWAYLGDGNNMANSLVEAASVLGFDLRLGVPHGYDPDQAVLATAGCRGGSIDLVRSAKAAVEGAQVVVTDTWVSMGQISAKDKLGAMMPFQVDRALMAKAQPDALFLHCLPAHRGEEVTADVIDGPQSAVWDEAENRLHVQKAILLWCLGKL
ncbi:ornithine carbamoyltransferase [Polymorphobacter fuscus]|uniref:Ornithine carbamoyltransferase n=1 Tax=Sandarakinorhabdus fusca TaxID=1439888 RepID=A0A7C9KUR2_9SPHN|nr:ornithine carbamoyltransferase [Polymorphobacter fuscus]KAB7649029.1 ornithine carbamoyltransferase [Polymorphobacter fuscus]MQT15705.1 ornithine carbamoyltransferase [Polymorphobacter fuscus]